jgi:hypothetical protein
MQKKVDAAQKTSAELEAFEQKWSVGATKAVEERYTALLHDVAVATAEGALMEALIYTGEAERAEEVTNSVNLCYDLNVTYPDDIMTQIVEKARDLIITGKPKKGRAGGKKNEVEKVPTPVKAGAAGGRSGLKRKDSEDSASGTSATGSAAAASSKGGGESHKSRKTNTSKIQESDSRKRGADGGGSPKASLKKTRV